MREQYIRPDLSLNNRPGKILGRWKGAEPICMQTLMRTHTIRHALRHRTTQSNNIPPGGGSAAGRGRAIARGSGARAAAVGGPRPRPARAPAARAVATARRRRTAATATTTVAAAGALAGEVAAAAALVALGRAARAAARTGATAARDLDAWSLHCRCCRRSIWRPADAGEERRGRKKGNTQQGRTGKKACRKAMPRRQRGRGCGCGGGGKRDELC